MTPGSGVPAANARTVGVEVRLDIFPEQQHTFQMAAGRAPEADDAIRRVAAWGHTSRAAWVAEPPI